MTTEEMSNPSIKIQTAPSLESLRQASETLINWHLHYYQLLYASGLAQSAPRYGKPFEVVLSLQYHPTLRIVCRQNPDYSFSLGWIKPEDQPDYDMQVLEKCQLILTALSAGKTKVSRYACCPLSKPGHCVCNYKDDCPIHGSRCNGSHD